MEIWEKTHNGGILYILCYCMADFSPLNAQNHILVLFNYKRKVCDSHPLLFCYKTELRNLRTKIRHCWSNVNQDFATALPISCLKRVHCYNRGKVSDQAAIDVRRKHSCPGYKTEIKTHTHTHRECEDILCSGHHYSIEQIVTCWYIKCPLKVIWITLHVDE